MSICHWENAAASGFFFLPLVDEVDSEEPLLLLHTVLVTLEVLDLDSDDDLLLLDRDMDRWRLRLAAGGFALLVNDCRTCSRHFSSILISSVLCICTRYVQHFTPSCHSLSSGLVWASMFLTDQPNLPQACRGNTALATQRLSSATAAW